MRCLTLNLSGEIGPDKPINLAGIRRQLAGHDFDCLDVRITSTGGFSKESVAICNHLRALPVPIKATAKKFCLSGGLIIFMAAALRTAQPGTEFLIHPTNCKRTDLPESVTCDILRAQADALAESDNAVVDILAARTGYDRAFYEAEKRTEDSLCDAAAIEAGIVHEITGLTQPCRPDWPEFVRGLAADPSVYVPTYQRTPNYFEACRTAAYFSGSPG